MSDGVQTGNEVFQATSEDVEFILSWLKREYKVDGCGFWCNRNVILKSSKDPEHLWVVRRKGEAIGFQVGRYSPIILSVRKDHRNSGVATSLVEGAIRRAQAEDVNVLAVHCEPETSYGFWNHMGFERYVDSKRPDAVLVRRILSRAFELPSDHPFVQVDIAFYPEAAGYGDRGNVPPIAEYHVEGVRDPDGSIKLERRVVGLSDNEPEGRDLVVRIVVGGSQCCFCKARYQAAQDAGVKRDSSGNSFFIDSVMTNR